MPSPKSRSWRSPSARPYRPSSAEWAAFRSIVFFMILDTDLAKHFQCVASFRKDFVEGNPPALDLPKHRQQLLSFVPKACDVGRSAKPLAVHGLSTTRINGEFFRWGSQGFLVPFQVPSTRGVCDMRLCLHSVSPPEGQCASCSRQHALLSLTFQ